MTYPDDYQEMPITRIGELLDKEARLDAAEAERDRERERAREAAQELTRRSRRDKTRIDAAEARADRAVEALRLIADGAQHAPSIAKVALAEQEKEQQ